MNSKVLTLFKSIFKKNIPEKEGENIKKNPFEKILIEINTMYPDIARIECPFFSRYAEIELVNYTKTVTIKLYGIHFWAMRQSRLSDDFYVGSLVSFFEITDDNPFLTSFLEAKIEFNNHLYIYDMEGRAKEKSDFVKPIYLNLDCGAGLLDVICERIEIFGPELRKDIPDEVIE